jgi:PHS family inorganic phosphate transporter-like MFS transporter
MVESLLTRLLFATANYGPNTTTFALPSIVYSPECRSTLNGLSAAAGKLGALVGATLFEPAADSFGDADVMLICSAIAAFAFVVAKIFVRIRDESELGTVV